MQFSTFAKSTEKVSRLGYGAMGLGGAFGSFDEAEATRSVLTSLEHGVNFFDTARHYGRSEEFLGKALKLWTGNKPFIATKIQSHGIGNTRWAIPPAVEEVFPCHLIRENTETSLRNLHVDCIDLMQLHLYWPTWGTEGYWLDELTKLKEEGKIRYIGVSNPDHRHDTVLPLVMSGQIDSVQTIINIFDPQALDCLVPICAQRKVAIIARCVLDEGGLAGCLTEETIFEVGDFRKTYFDEVPRAQYIQHVNALKKFIPSQASSLAKLAIKHVLKNTGVTTAIASMHIEKYALENISVFNEPPISDETFYELYTIHRWTNNLYHTKYWSGFNDLDKSNAIQQDKIST
jgi:aryl-alcohol dehydrogenase-like predicted oxidoreductase